MQSYLRLNTSFRKQITATHYIHYYTYSTWRVYHYIYVQEPGMAIAPTACYPNVSRLWQTTWELPTRLYNMWKSTNPSLLHKCESPGLFIIQQFHKCTRRNALFVYICRWTWETMEMRMYIHIWESRHTYVCDTYYIRNLKLCINIYQSTITTDH